MRQKAARLAVDNALGKGVRQAFISVIIAELKLIEVVIEARVLFALRFHHTGQT